MAVLSAPTLDALDWQLLELLQEDARLTFAELGRRLGLSPPAVAERVRRLEETGIVRGYHAEVDLGRLGMPMQAVIRVVTTNVAECADHGRRLASVEEVLECQRVTGTDSYIARVAVRSMDHLEDLLSRVAPNRGDTITAMVLSTPVPRRAVRRALLEG